MDSTPSTPFLDLPPEIWELIFNELTGVDLWPIRSLNRTTYEFAARARYGALWIVPHKENNLIATMKRLRQDCLQIKGLLHTLHIHSNIGGRVSTNKAQRHVPKALWGLIRKILCSPDMSIQSLTIHFDTIILPYVILAWTNTAHSLVHLELQFSASSPHNPWLSLKSMPRFHNLKTFVLSNGSSNDWPSFRSMAIMDLGHPCLDQRELLFLKLNASLPEGLESLGIHLLYRGNFWTYQRWEIPSSFLSPNNFPHLRNFDVSNLPLDKYPSLCHFINARLGSLQSLGLERIRDNGSRFLHRLSGTTKLEALSLSLDSAGDALNADILQAGQRVSPIHRFQHLRRLNITPFKEDYSEDVVFVLLVELGRGSNVLQELNVCTPSLGFRHLRAALLFPPGLAQLTFAGTWYCEPDMRKVSAHPEIWSSLDCRTYTLFHLGHAKRCLGGDVRQELAAELRSDVQSAYKHLISTAQGWDKLHSYMKKALNGEHFMEDRATNTIGIVRSDMQVDHRMLVMQLVESCLQY
ncbi:hypothetical protein DL96DRAFT_1821316 [Flagelloscypha sp. PMI_526]|nr:hypothetical protein DL96DRAFT_1821316 [Flagelloscypha sp. PMI_526]